jgi:hypothetical protein
VNKLHDPTLEETPPRPRTLFTLRSCLHRIAALALVTVFTFAAPNAEAVESSAQRSCLGTIHKAIGKVAKAQSKVGRKCLSAFDRGKDLDFGVCVGRVDQPSYRIEKNLQATLDSTSVDSVWRCP